MSPRRFVELAPPLSVLLMLACAESPPTAPPPEAIIDDEERILIVDRTGKSWDITHAVNVYGFKPGGFQFGLGPNAIPPIVSPSFLCPEADRYPADDETFLVMGVQLNGHTRAYPITVMSAHEVVDDRFGNRLAAVAY